MVDFYSSGPAKVEIYQLNGQHNVLVFQRNKTFDNDHGTKPPVREKKIVVFRSTEKLLGNRCFIFGNDKGLMFVLPVVTTCIFIPLKPLFIHLKNGFEHKNIKLPVLSILRMAFL